MASLELVFEDEDKLPDGTCRSEELKTGGSQILVTDDNKLEYLQLLAERRLSQVVSKEVEEFISGFYSILPSDLLSIFDENEVELLICGLPVITASDFLQHITWVDFDSNDKEMRWFKLSVEVFSNEERTRLLQFITGSSQVPASGFGEIKPPLKIKKWPSAGVQDHLPRVSSCFNTCFLPPYTSYDKCHQQLLTAITEGTEGFTFN